MEQRGITRKASLHVVEQIRYRLLYKAKFDGFKQKLPAHGESIAEMGTLIGAQTHSERRQSIARLQSFKDEHEEGRRKGKEIENGTIDMLERMDEHLEGQTDGVDATEALRKVEKDLVAEGEEKKEVDERTRPIWEVVRLHSNQELASVAKAPEIVQLEKFTF